MHFAAGVEAWEAEVERVARSESVDGGRGTGGRGRLRRIGSLNHSRERRLDSIRELVILAGPEPRRDEEREKKAKRRKEGKRERGEGNVLD